MTLTDRRSSSAHTAPSSGRGRFQLSRPGPSPVVRPRAPCHCRESCPCGLLSGHRGPERRALSVPCPAVRIASSVSHQPLRPRAERLHPCRRRPHKRVHMRACATAVDLIPPPRHEPIRSIRQGSRHAGGGGGARSLELGNPRPTVGCHLPRIARHRAGGLTAKPCVTGTGPTAIGPATTEPL